MFSLNDQLNGVLPPGLIYAFIHRISIVFRNTKFEEFCRIPNLIYGPGNGGVDVTIEGGVISNIGSFITGANGSLAFSRAINYTGGLIVAGGLPNPSSTFGNSPTIHGTSSPVMGMHANTLTPFATTDNPFAKDLRNPGGQLRTPLNQFAETFNDENGVSWKLVAPPQNLFDMGIVGNVPVAPAFSNDVMTFEYAAAVNSYAPIHVGDTLYSINTSTLFVITAIGAADGAHSNALPITTKQMNNMTVNNSTGVFMTQTCTDLTLAGYAILTNCSIDVPLEIEFGTFTAGCRRQR